MNTEYTKITLSIPKHIVDDLRGNTRNMSKYVSEAVTEKREKERRTKAMQEILAYPATFTDIDDPTEYIRTLRSRDLERMKRLGLYE